jgi:hypothetical protein
VISAILEGDGALVARLDAMPAALHGALLARVTTLAATLEDRVREKLGGAVLVPRSGALRRSIASEITDETERVLARVFSAGDLPYAAIQEYGGRIPPHEIVPRKAAALAFLVAGKPVFAKRVRFPGAVIPEHAYLRGALGDLAAEIVAGLKQAVTDAIQDQTR